MPKTTAPPLADQIEQWYRDWFCNREDPYTTEVQNVIREAVADLKSRVAAEQPQDRREAGPKLSATP